MLLKKKESPSILHLTVRTDKGGAARIAKDLHARHKMDGHNSVLLNANCGINYRNIEGNSESNVISISNKMRVALNLAGHRLIGSEFVGLGRSSTNFLIRCIKNADVVHVHIAHSYFLPVNLIFRLLELHARKVVWTAHDYWLLTGRCASPGNCLRWEIGCGKCPSKSSYPPAYLDRSAGNHTIKQAGLKNIRDKLTIVAPTKEVASVFSRALPEFNVKTISNGLDCDFESNAERYYKNSGRILSAESTGIIIAGDLSDRRRVDRNIIDLIVLNRNNRLLMLGRNSPYIASANITNISEIEDREDYVELLCTVDYLLFTSRIDTFGLVMIEALSLGLPVLAVESDASKFILSSVDARPFRDSEECVAIATGKIPLNALYRQCDFSAISKAIKIKFGGNLMYQSYLSLYTE